MKLWIVMVKDRPKWVTRSRQEATIVRDQYINENPVSVGPRPGWQQRAKDCKIFGPLTLVEL